MRARTDLVARDALDSRVNDYVVALAKCERGVVQSMKRQINAIAAGDKSAAAVRHDYDESLRSAELRKRVGAASKGE